MKLEQLTEATSVVVKIIGLGGAGCSSLNRLSETRLNHSRMLGIDTGSATASLSSGVDALPIGNGCSSGGDPETAVQLFKQYESRVGEFIVGADVVIILAGLGRGTGSALAPEIARLSKRSGALTIAAVNMPFEFEGRVRAKTASEAHDILKHCTDTVLTMCNDDLLIGGAVGVSLSDAFYNADMNIAGAVHAITLALESSPERSLAVQNSLLNAGESAVVSGSSTGLQAGSMAVANAFASTSNDFVCVRTVVVHVEGGIGLSLGQVTETVAKIHEEVGLEVPVYVSSERLIGLGQEINVTIVFSGIGKAAVNETAFTPSQLIQREIATTAKMSVFNTQAPLRTRGPVLLPTG